MAGGTKIRRTVIPFNPQEKYDQHCRYQYFSEYYAKRKQKPFFHVSSHLWPYMPNDDYSCGPSLISLNGHVLLLNSTPGCGPGRPRLNKLGLLRSNFASQLLL